MAKKNSKKKTGELSNEELMNARAEANKKAADSLKDYNEILKEVNETNKKLLEQQKQMAALNLEQKQIKSALAQNNLSSEKRRILKASLKLNKENIKILEKSNKNLLNQKYILESTLTTSNKLSASFRTLGDSTAKMAKDVWDLNKGWGAAMGWLKDIQGTEKAMAISANNAKGFRDNLAGASVVTNQLGVSAGKLAKMQGSYSEQIGRSVQLSQKGLVAMSEMAQGTVLGTEGAAQMAANMDDFGISVEGTRDRVEDMVNLAGKMGVNSAKVIKNLQKNMKLANKYHFKGGVAGMTKMATKAAQLNIDMDSLGSAADKFFRPEGAIEAASKLQTLGGEFAKLDGMQMMFKARNDFEGFTMDIVNATKEFATFNEKSGEFEISGLQLDRVKEISKAIGISSETLIDMSRKTAKASRIEAVTTLDSDDSAFIAGIAQFDEATKQYNVTVKGSTKNIKTLNKDDIKLMKQQKQSLEERAKQAQTFDETFNNLKNTFKSLLVPVLNGLSETIKGPLANFMKRFGSKGGLGEKLTNMGSKLGGAFIKFGEWAEPLVSSLVNFVTDNPITSLLTGGAAMLAGKMTLWYARGAVLGQGFNSTAAPGMGGGGLTGKGGRFRNAKAGYKAAGKGGKGAIGKMMGGAKGFLGKTGGKIGGKGLAKVLGKSLLKKIPLIGLAAGAGFAIDRMMDGDFKGAGLEALSGLASTVPGIGTAASVGIDGLLAARDAGLVGGDKKIDQYGDVIMRSGQAPIGIDSKDDVLAIKKGGAVDKVMDNTGSNTSSKSSVSKINFGPININGKIELTGNGNNKEIDLDNPMIMRELSRILQEELRKAIGGGKLNPNPI